jgi:sugar (pentulose or hexulose) kinase
MSEQVYLGIDLGAESGRVMAGIWNGRAMRVEELHRFPNGPVNVADTLRWDVLRLWTEIQMASPLRANDLATPSFRLAWIPGAWILCC